MTDEISVESCTDTVRNKIVFVGDMSVGKTSVMVRFMENSFKDAYSVRLLIIISLQSVLTSSARKCIIEGKA
jgi:GTPase SAR1 family protein